MEGAFGRAIQEELGSSSVQRATLLTPMCSSLTKEEYFRTEQEVDEASK